MKNIEEFWHRCELKKQKFGAQLQTVYFFCTVPQKQSLTEQWRFNFKIKRFRHSGTSFSCTCKPNRALAHDFIRYHGIWQISDPPVQRTSSGTFSQVKLTVDCAVNSPSQNVLKFFHVKNDVQYCLSLPLLTSDVLVQISNFKSRCLCIQELASLILTRACSVAGGVLLQEALTENCPCLRSQLSKIDEL